MGLKFSIVTPVFNGAEYIEKCIVSIKNQTYRNFEHIIMDGGSNDETLDIIERYKGTYNMRVVSEKDQGMYDAIVKGFALATGDIFSWLNADDMYMPWALRIMEEAFRVKQVHWIMGHLFRRDTKDMDTRWMKVVCV